MPENSDADVMKLKVREVRNVAINGGVAPIAFRFGVEKYPATLGGDGRTSFTPLDEWFE
jgi:hypothetical protein